MSVRIILFLPISLFLNHQHQFFPSLTKTGFTKDLSPLQIVFMQALDFQETYFGEGDWGCHGFNFPYGVFLYSLWFVYDGLSLLSLRIPPYTFPFNIGIFLHGCYHNLHLGYPHHLVPSHVGTVLLFLPLCGDGHNPYGQHGQIQIRMMRSSVKARMRTRWASEAKDMALLRMKWMGKAMEKTRNRILCSSP